jgi:hypothetical protein
MVRRARHNGELPKPKYGHCGGTSGICKRDLIIVRGKLDLRGNVSEQKRVFLTISGVI